MTSSAPPLREDLDHVRFLVGDRWQALRGKRLFVTGGTGFVGKWLLATLQDANARYGLACKATVLSRQPDVFRASTPWLANDPAFELLRGDVRDFAFPNGPFTHVVHAATDVANMSTPLQTFDTCVQGTRRTLEFAASAGARDVLLVSSGAVYGRQPVDRAAIDESFGGAPDPLEPSAAYAEGKRAAEHLAAIHAAHGALRVPIARCFAFIGPYLPLDGHLAMCNFLRDATLGRPVVVRGDGTVQRSYMHGADLAGWLWTILVNGRSAVAYNVGSDEAVSLRDAAALVAGLAANGAGIDIRGASVERPGLDRYVPDVGRARREFALPPPLAFDEAVRRTLRWLEHATPGIVTDARTRSAA